MQEAGGLYGDSTLFLSGEGLVGGVNQVLVSPSTHEEADYKTSESLLLSSERERRRGKTTPPNNAHRETMIVERRPPPSV